MPRAGGGAADTSGKPAGCGRPPRSVSGSASEPKSGPWYPRDRIVHGAHAERLVVIEHAVDHGLELRKEMHVGIARQRAVAVGEDRVLMVEADLARRHAARERLDRQPRKASPSSL